MEFESIYINVHQCSRD